MCGLQLSSIVIKTESDARNLLRLQQLYSLNRPRVLIRIEGLPQQEARVWEDKLDTIRQMCGCRSGAAAVVIFILAAVGYGLLAEPHTLISHGNVALDTGAFAAGLVLSGIIGKLIGLSAASTKYRYICRQLIERVQAL